MQLATIRIPGRVYDDYLDPMVSGMAAELELAKPLFVKRGKGTSALYAMTAEQALEVAGYLHDRGVTLLGQGISDPYDPFEKADRDTHRAAIKTAERIRQEVVR